MEPGIKAGDARTMRHRKRHEVDRYASVPSFTEDMPVHEEPNGVGGFAVPVDEETEEAEEAGVPAAPALRTPRSTAGERPASRRVSPSAAAKRSQPSRKPRSQRGKG
jgi:preprotein translocase subunit SecF